MSSDPKALIAAKFLDSFLREIVFDTAIHTHARIKRARSICYLCGYRCQAHTPAAEPPLTNTTASTSLTPSSRSNTPIPGPSSGGVKADYYSNNPLFECLVCSRQVSSNRYATHLAKCMGMGSKGGRKGAARNAKAAASVSAPVSRSSGTPRYGSDLDDDFAAKRKNGGNGKGGVKRANSPLAAAAGRLNKRLKTSSPTPPPSEPISAGPGLNRTFSSSQPFAPSALRDSTTLSGSPLNPKHNGKNGAGGGKNKRKRLLDDEDDEEDDDGGESFRDPGSGGSNNDGSDGDEEGEISDDDGDDDEDVALASRPASKGTKIKIPLPRANSTSSSTTNKPKTFMVVDDSDQASDDDDDDDDEEEEESDDEEDDVQVTRVSHTQSGTKKKKEAKGDASGLQRERGSDGEFIDVESASEQSDADSF